ncbi:uncharacterized protein MYCGRDRAFT_111306 [Zymoseptoria tritici IPO323]|uniref:Uncharacterized protein n=1 Tax=Zymoseptoria tritici (strain CBS 115943 / IPO323) TaxID=336722 RepID=F9XNC1_ZYMTI|nr:uncharacterized protein MYCGRDRAFT_111306 [Zymoseptoria tritici IPO323]EGP83542.1 hypothetical protein MYCGRDRAFT_111306 [Zymoseptoria tritici IPO323]
MQQRSDLHARDLLNVIATKADRKKLLKDYPHLFDFGEEYTDRKRPYGGLRGRPLVKQPTSYFVPTGEIYPTPDLLRKADPTSMPPQAFSKIRKTKDGQAELLVPEFRTATFASSKSALLEVAQSKATSMPSTYHRSQGGGQICQNIYFLHKNKSNRGDDVVLASCLVGYYLSEGSLVFNYLPHGWFENVFDELLDLAKADFYTAKLASMKVPQAAPPPSQPTQAIDEGENNQPTSIEKAPNKRKSRKMAAAKAATTQDVEEDNDEPAQKRQKPNQPPVEKERDEEPTSIDEPAKKPAAPARRRPASRRSRPATMMQMIMEQTDEDTPASMPVPRMNTPQGQAAKLRMSKLQMSTHYGEEDDDLILTPKSQRWSAKLKLGTNMPKSTIHQARARVVKEYLECLVRWLCLTKEERDMKFAVAANEFTKFHHSQEQIDNMDRLFLIPTDPIAPANQGMRAPDAPSGPFPEWDKFEPVYRLLCAQVDPKMKIGVIWRWTQALADKVALTIRTPSNDPYLTFWMEEWVFRKKPNWSWEIKDPEPPTSIDDILGLFHDTWSDNRKDALRLMLEIREDPFTTEERIHDAIRLLRKCGIAATKEQVTNPVEGWAQLKTSTGSFKGREPDPWDPTDPSTQRLGGARSMHSHSKSSNVGSVRTNGQIPRSEVPLHLDLEMWTKQLSERYLDTTDLKELRTRMRHILSIVLDNRKCRYVQALKICANAIPLAEKTTGVCYSAETIWNWHKNIGPNFKPLEEPFHQLFPCGTDKEA